MVLLCNIDLNGVKDCLANMGTATKQAVYQGYTGVECSPETAEAFFHVPTQTEVRDKFLAEFGNKLLKGKFEETENILATYASLGLAFIGLDVPQDMRDLSYDILHWENSWEHVGETALDGIGLLPVVGILGKTDEALAIVKHSDRLYELRRLTKLDDVLKTIGESKYITKSQELANTAMQKLQAVNPSIYRKILNYCDNSAGYREAYAMAGSYSNPVTDTLIRYADDLEDISKVSNSLTREVVEEVAEAGSRNADNLDDVAEAAIESAKKRLDEVVEGDDLISPDINMDKIYEHVFSQDHVNQGIMQLGETESDIINKFFDIAKSTKGKWSEGSNEIRTFIDEVEVTIRIYIENGQLKNLNGFVGHSNRIVGKLISV